MRKILIGLLVLALLALFTGVIYNGILIGNVNLGYSIPQIIAKNDELDGEIEALQKEIDTGYETAKSSLDSSFRKLQAEKQNYQSTIAYTTEEDLKNANKTEQYKLNFLWTNIGGYATRNGVVMKADLSHGTSGVKDQYNISFTAIGPYISISEFIYAIEKDPELGFRIEEFSMVPYSEETLQATFIIKNVNIDPNSLSNSASVSNGTVTNNPSKDSPGTDGQKSGNTNTNTANGNTNTNTNSNSNTNTNTGNSNRNANNSNTNTNTR